MFANQGEYVKPSFINLVRGQDGKTLLKNTPDRKKVLDPRVAYLMTNLMEEVLRSGTGAGVRARLGYNVPAAGKTGTSHDGWFAGYTSELLCVVWVGFDDNSELDLQGAYSAAPIWAEFMKRALDYREYRDTKPFQAPDGIVTIAIDPMSGMPATPNCPKTQDEVYIAGTEPVGSCPLHGGRQSMTTVAGWSTAPAATANPDGYEVTPSNAAAAPDANAGAVAGRLARQNPAQQAKAEPPAPPNPADAAKPPRPKKSLLRRLFGVFK
jgi:penicillin-binding protein 1B